MTTLQQAREAACNKYAWPGGYPLYLLCADGEVICPDCAKKEWKQVAYATKHPGTDKQWGLLLTVQSCVSSVRGSVSSGCCLCSETTGTT